jgi:excisionase family DNA binding protein
MALPNPTECLWEVKDLAEYLRIPASSVYKMTAPRAASGLPVIRCGQLLRFRRSDIDKWLDGLANNTLESKVTDRIRRATRSMHRGNIAEKETA